MGFAGVRNASSQMIQNSFWGMNLNGVKPLPGPPLIKGGSFALVLKLIASNPKDQKNCFCAKILKETGGFQSTPNQKGQENPVPVVLLQQPEIVSIHSQPERPGELVVPANVADWLRVSIHSQPERPGEHQISNRGK